MNTSATGRSFSADSRAQSDTQQYLTFQLGGEMFAVAILNIKEILEYASLTSVPMMPGFMRGVINLRGRVVPVIDLSARFGRPPTIVGRRTSIVIVEAAAGGDAQDIGIVVDAVCEVLAIADVDIEPGPSFGTKVRSDFISGMGKVDGDFIILLNVANVLSVDEMNRLTSEHAEGAAHLEVASASSDWDGGG